MNKTTFGCLLGGLILILAGSIGLNFVQFVALAGSKLSLGPQPREPLTEKLEVPARSQSSRDKIVHLDLDGIITSVRSSGLFEAAMPSVDSLKKSLEQALNDDNVKAIVLRINSPGGEVTASDILYAAVKKAAEKKPVVIYMDAVAASGGYYIACGASKVVASETTLTASIGVIMESMSYHDLFGKVGLATQTFKSGPYKDTLSGARPMRDDERVYVQGLVDSMYDRFLSIVSEARNVPKDVLKNTVADGRVVTGRQALEAKLVDQIGYIEDAYEEARKLGSAPDAAVVRYESSPSLLNALGLASSKASEPAKIELSLPGAHLPKLQPGMMYYLPGAYLR